MTICIKCGKRLDPWTADRHKCEDAVAEKKAA